MKKIIFLIYFGIFCGSTLAKASGLTPSQIDAATLTGEEIFESVMDLNYSPMSIALLFPNSNPPLDPAFSDLLEAEIIRAFIDDPKMRLVPCLECRVPKVKLEGQNLVVERGLIHSDRIKELSKKLGVEAFLSVESYLTEFAIITQAYLIVAETGEIVPLERVRAGAIDYNGGSLFLRLDTGSGLVWGGKPIQPRYPAVPIEVSLSALTQMDFGKLGFNVGALLAEPRGSLYYLMPALGLPGRLGEHGIWTLTQIGVGFGVSDHASGLMSKMSYDVFINPLFYLGVDVFGLMDFQKSIAPFAKPIHAGIAAHLGFYLGR
jgi:hypothetical protein